MRNIILAATATLTLSATAAFAESPNLDNQSFNQRGAVEASQADTGTESFGLSNPDVTAAAAISGPMGLGPDATGLRQRTYGN